MSTPQDQIPSQAPPVQPAQTSAPEKPSQWTVPQFAQSIREKYPVYKDWSDHDLTASVLAKHSEYDGQINYADNDEKIAVTELRVKSAASTMKSVADRHNAAQQITGEGSQIKVPGGIAQPKPVQKPTQRQPTQTRQAPRPAQKPQQPVDADMKSLILGSRAASRGEAPPQQRQSEVRRLTVPSHGRKQTQPLADVGAAVGMTDVRAQAERDIDAQRSNLRGRLDMGPNPIANDPEREDKVVRRMVEIGSGQLEAFAQELKQKKQEDSPVGQFVATQLRKMRALPRSGAPISPETVSTYLEGVTHAIGSTLGQVAGGMDLAYKYFPGTALARKVVPGLSDVEDAATGGVRNLGEELQAGASTATKEHPSDTALGRFGQSVTRGVGGLTVEGPKLLLGGEVLGAANLPVQGALSREQEGATGLIKGAGGGIIYHYGMGLTGPALGRVGNTLTWIAIPTAEGVAQGQSFGEALGSALPMGALAGVGPSAEKPEAQPEPVQVKEGDTVRPATVDDLPKITSGQVEVVPPKWVGDITPEQAQKGQEVQAAQGVVPQGLSQGAAKTEPVLGSDVGQNVPRGTGTNEPKGEANVASESGAVPADLGVSAKPDNQVVVPSLAQTSPIGEKVLNKNAVSVPAQAETSASVVAPASATEPPLSLSPPEESRANPNETKLTPEAPTSTVSKSESTGAEGKAAPLKTVEGDDIRMGARKAFTEPEREAQGLGPVEMQIYKTGGDAYLEGKKNVIDQRVDAAKLAQEVAENPRQITPAEIGALSYHGAKLLERMDELRKGLETETDTKSRGLAQFELDHKLSQFDDATQALKKGGRENSAALNAMKILVTHNYGVSEGIARAKAWTPDGTISPRREAVITKAAENVSTAKAEIERLTKERESVLDAREQAASAKEEELSKREAKLAAGKIAREVRRTGRVQKKTDLDVEFKQLKTNLAAAFAKVKRPDSGIQPSLLSRLDPEGDITKVLVQMARNRIEAGVTDVSEIVDHIYTQAKEFMPSLTPRDIRDAISNYGKTARMSDDPIDVGMRKARSLMRDVSAIEDIDQGQLPARSGLQRDKPDAELRQSRKNVQDALKKAGLAIKPSENPEDEFKSYVEAAQTRLRNEIEDIDYQLKNGKRGPKVSAPKGTTDTLEALKIERDLVKKQLNDPAETRKEELAKRNAELERKIADGDIQVKEKGFRYEDATEKQLRERRKELLKQKAAIVSKLTEETRLRTSIDKLDQRLKARDINTPKKPGAVDSPAVAALKAERDLQNKALAKLRQEAKDALKPPPEERARQIVLDRLGRKIDQVNLRTKLLGLTGRNLEQEGKDAAKIKREQREKLLDTPEIREQKQKLIDAQNRWLRASAKPATIPQIVSAVRKVGLISTIKSLSKHVGSVTTNLAFQELSRLNGSLVDTAMSMATGKRTVEGVNPMGIVRAGIAGATRGLEEARQVMKTGTTPEDMKKLQLNRELNTDSPLLNNYVNYLFRTRSAIDRPFAVYATTRSIEEQANVMARNEAKVGTIKSGDIKARAKFLRENPTVDMQAQAALDSLVATFKDQNIVSKFTGAIRRQGAGAEFLLDQFIPFDKTPTNVVLRTLEATPIGGVYTLGRAGVKLAIDKAMTPQEQRLFSQRMGRAMTGTALIYLGAKLGQAGLITGSEDQTKKQNYGDEAKGPQSYSIKIGGRWFQLNPIFSPIGTMLGLGATLARDTPKQGKLGGAYNASVRGLINIVKEQPELSNAIEIGKDLDPRTDEGSKAGKALGSWAGSYIPTAVSDLAAAQDRTQRETDYRAPALRQGVQQVEKRLPFLRRNLPAMTDSSGQVVKFPWYQPFDPLNSRPASQPAASSGGFRKVPIFRKPGKND